MASEIVHQYTIETLPQSIKLPTFKELEAQNS